MHFRGDGVASRMGESGGRPPEVPVVPVSDLADILDHVVHVQAKFYEIDDDLTDHYIPWAPFLDLLASRNWSGCLSSEYEGDYATGRAADQLRRQHALLRILAGDR